MARRQLKRGLDAPVDLRYVVTGLRPAGLVDRLAISSPTTVGGHLVAARHPDIAGARVQQMRFEQATLWFLLGVTWCTETWSRWGTRRRCWRIVSKSDIVERMDRYMTADRLVLVPAAQLDDLLELARLSVERIPDPDPLRAALAGSISAIRLTGIIEP